MSPDRETFERLFRENFNRLCNKAYRLTRDRDVACDIVQEVFFRLWTKRESLGNVASMEAYLYQSVVYYTLNFIKHEKQVVFVRDHADESILKDYSPEEILQHREFQERIDRAIQLLPPGCRQVFILNRDENMSYREIAKHLSLSINSVEKHMTRALRILRTHLQSLLIFLSLFFLGE